MNLFKKFFHKKEQKVQPIAMGLGKFANCNTVFIRSFRFTLETYFPGVHDTQYWFDDIDIDLVNSTLKCSIKEFYEKPNQFDPPFNDLPQSLWLEELLKGKITNFILTTYDGCGYPIWRRDFEETKLDGHKLHMEYGDSSVLTNYLTFKYNKTERKFLQDDQDDSQDITKPL